MNKRIKGALLRADFHILSSNILWLRVDRISGTGNLGIFFYIIPKLQENADPYDENQKLVPFC